MLKIRKVRKIDLLMATIGIVIGSLLTSYTYYANSHQAAPRLDDWIYLVLFPPSLGLMTTENASSFHQAIIISAVIVENGLLYGLASAGIRRILR